MICVPGNKIKLGWGKPACPEHPRFAISLHTPNNL